MSSVDRPMRGAVAAVFLVAALFLAMNLIVSSAPLVDGWLALVLFVIGVLLGFAPDFARRDAEREAAETAIDLSVRVHTMTIHPDPELSQYDVAVVQVLPFGEEAPPGGDDLTRISGIGPKSHAALKAAGIDTYEKLAFVTEDGIREALQAKGVVIIGDISSWTKQAEFASRSDWEGLANYNIERKSAGGN